MRVTSHERIISFLFLHAVVLSSPCISAASFFTKREREREKDVALDIFARIKKAEARSRWCAPLRLSCLRTRTYVHVRGSCNSHISVHADDCSACNKLRSVQRLQARPSPVSHDTSRGSPTYRVSFQYLFFFHLFFPSPLRNSESPVTTIRTGERACLRPFRFVEAITKESKNRSSNKRCLACYSR